MHDKTIAYIYANMSTIINNVTWLCFWITYRCSTQSLWSWISRKWNTKISEYRLCKSRTVCSICKWCSTWYIRISNKLLCKISYLLSLRWSAARWSRRRLFRFLFFLFCFRSFFCFCIIWSWIFWFFSFDLYFFILRVWIIVRVLLLITSFLFGLFLFLKRAITWSK